MTTPTEHSETLLQLKGIVLASTSPRRRSLLTHYGIEHLALAPDVVEAPLPGETAQEYVLRNGQLKALSVCERYPAECQNQFVVASDTVVVAPSGRILEKPRDPAEARAMLAELNGQTHQVLSSIVIAYGHGPSDAPAGSANPQAHGNAIVLCAEAISTKVTFGALPEAWVENYIATPEPYDKAGGYGIQDLAGAFVQSIEGSYSNVVGLPLYETFALLTDLSAVRNFFTRSLWQPPDSLVPSPQIVAVSKKKHPSALRLAALYGQRDFGESYAQELESKRVALRDIPGMTWHFLGKLQSNKLGIIARSADVVHSLEDIEKANQLAAECLKAGRKLRVFIKCEVSPLTAAASGCSWDQARTLAHHVLTELSASLDLCGFMGMAPLGVSPLETEDLFKSFLRSGVDLWQHLKTARALPEFSLGMSGDAILATQAARDLGLPLPVIRLGSAIFGDRNTSLQF